jgi:type II secretory pathway component PulF
VATLDEFIALNDQLAAAIDAGLPLVLDLGAVGGEPLQALERINAIVARHVSRGLSPEEAILAASSELPPQYRSLALLWLRSDDRNAVLDRASELGDALVDSREDSRLALVYPAIVFALALAGMTTFCLFVFPKLQNFRGSMRLPLGEGMDALEWLVGLWPAWGAAGAIMVMVVLWFVGRTARPGSSRNARGMWARFTGKASADFDERTAAFADWLALLLSAGVAEDESLHLASEASGDDRLRAVVASLPAGSLEALASQPATASALRRFPPFLRWALVRTDPAQRDQSLHIAAEVYRNSARRSSERARVVAPIVASALIGGGAVLLYGLSLFIPMTEMLRSVATMH